MPSHKGKYLDLFLTGIGEITLSSSCLISGSDHLWDSLSASFQLFLFSSFSKSSQMESTLCASM